jgi:hypothetical protein
VYPLDELSTTSEQRAAKDRPHVVDRVVVPRNPARLPAQLESVLSPLEVLPFEAPADSIYGAVRTQLEQAGRHALKQMSWHCQLVFLSETAFAIATCSELEPMKPAGLRA